ncbi:hypothetical protein V8C86DRAFT_2824787 [Haematococcus lacustris]
MGWYGWWGWWQSPPSTSKEVINPDHLAKTRRICKAYASALDTCRKANPENRTEMCRRLELKLTTCIAERHAAPEADEHRRCYSKVFLTGLYNGLGHCIPYEEAMKQALRSKGLYPV